MTNQDIATLALIRWAELRKQGVSCKERLNDPDLQKYEQQLHAVRKEMRDA